MPSLPTANGFPRTEKCFESRHLSSSDFKVYHVMLACAIAYKKARNDSGTLIFQYSVLPWLCNAVPTSENNARKIIERLVEQGWLIILENNRYAHGRKLPNVYQVVTHDEFLRTHPDSCPPNAYGPDGEPYEKGSVPINFAKAALAALLRRLRSADLKPDHDLTTPASRALASELEMIGEDEIRADFTVPTIAGTVSPHNRSETVPTIGAEQSPELRAISLSTSLNTSQHTVSPEPTVCDVSGEKRDDEEEIAHLEAGFVKHNQGEAGKLTGRQKEQLKALLARHDRDKFRRAARAWFKAPTWNTKTTDPFLLFINGFNGFLAKAGYDDEEQKRKQEFLGQKAETDRRSAQIRAEAWDALTPKDKDEPKADEFLK